jgi:uncharacterized membrane protein
MSSVRRTGFILVALLYLFGAASPAAAALKICNRTSYVLYTATAVAAQSTITAQGWTRVAPGACQAVLAGDLTASAYYVYARSSLAHSGPARAWGGDKPICVKDVNFATRDPVATRDCTSNSFFPLPFAAVDTHHMKSWTMTLSESAAIATLDQARAVGLKRLLRDIGYRIVSMESGSDNQADRALLAFRKRLHLSPKASDADMFDALETDALKVTAPTGYAICNDTAKPVAAAIGEKTARSWISHGWWTIASGSCAKAITAPLTAANIYLFVQKIGGAPLVTGDAKFCVADIEFDIEGRSRCKDRGLSETGFAETRVQGVAGYAVHVGEGGLVDPHHTTTSK